MDITKKSALRFILLLGIVSLFADLTYEGARSIHGQFLEILGASGTVVGIVAGLGELISYSLRLFSGYIIDKTKKYWTITITGYTVNLIAVPLLALAGHWQTACLLIIIERFGKSIRTPARDLMLSHANSKVGQGFGFGLHEALDQIGAIAGPLIVAIVLYLKGSYQSCFALLLVPALLALCALLFARFTYSNPRDFETKEVKSEAKAFPKAFWLYIIVVSLVACGYADFALIAYHFKKVQAVQENWIPVFYAFAMGIDALSALSFGKMFDKFGMKVLIFSVLLSSFFAPLVFLGNFQVALLGMTLWGIGMGTQESIMRAAISNMVQTNVRGFAFGIFNSAYGIFWFLGSALMGFLYDISVIHLVLFSVLVQLVALLILTMRFSKSFFS